METGTVAEGSGLVDTIQLLTDRGTVVRPWGSSLLGLRASLVLVPRYEDELSPDERAMLECRLTPGGRLIYRGDTLTRDEAEAWLGGIWEDDVEKNDGLVTAEKALKEVEGAIGIAKMYVELAQEKLDALKEGVK